VKARTGVGGGRRRRGEFRRAGRGRALVGGLGGRSAARRRLRRRADQDETRCTARPPGVEVAPAEPAKARGGFDPRGIYERESPGRRDGHRHRPGRPRQRQLRRPGLGLRGLRRRARSPPMRTWSRAARGPTSARPSNVFVRFADGNQVPAEVKGFDPLRRRRAAEDRPEGPDAAPAAAGLDEGPARRGRRWPPSAGPFGEEQSLSVGVISALDRSIQSLTGFDTTGAIQTDAAINHGNSGGPLLDGRGARAGASTPRSRPPRATARAVGFAVPADTVRRSLGQLRRDGAGRATPTSGVASVAVYPQLAAPLRPAGAVGRLDPGRHRRRARRARAQPQAGRRHQSASRSAPSAPAATVVTAVQGHPGARGRATSPRPLLDYEPGATVNPRRPARETSAARCASSSASAPLDTPRRG